MSQPDWIPDPNATPADQEVQRGENIEQERIDHAIEIDEQAKTLVSLGFKQGRDSIAMPYDEFWVELGVWPEVRFTELGMRNVIARFEDLKNATEQARLLLGRAKISAADKKLVLVILDAALVRVEGPPPAEDD